VNSQRTSLNGFDVTSPTSAALKHRAFKLANIETYSDGQSDGIQVITVNDEPWQKKLTRVCIPLIVHVQVLRYEREQAYIPHTDYFAIDTSPDHNWDARDGGTNRWATVFLYLSNVTSGGETVFPLVDPTPEMAAVQAQAGDPRGVLKSGSWESDMAGQCASRFAVKPKLGDALLFYSQFPSGDLDERSLHGGCPVLDGTKWAANVWIWNGCRYGVCKNLPKRK
jgi:prolyl 4-hydroxylase